MSSKRSQRHGPQAGRRSRPASPAVSAALRRPRWKLILALALTFCVAAWCGAMLWKDLGKTSSNPSLSPPATRIGQETGPPVAPRPAQKDQAFRALVNQGSELLGEGKPEEAARVLMEAMQINPADEDVHYDLGLAFGRLGKVAQAIQQYEEALRLFPNYVEAHNNLGNLLMRTGHLDQAIQHFETALKIMPDYASAHNNLGTALQRTGRTNEALVHFERAVQINPDYWEAHFNVATSCLTGERLREARRELETVLRLQPGFQPAKRALAEVDARQAADGH